MFVEKVIFNLHKHTYIDIKEQEGSRGKTEMQPEGEGALESVCPLPPYNKNVLTFPPMQPSEWLPETTFLSIHIIRILKQLDNCHRVNTSYAVLFVIFVTKRGTTICLILYRRQLVPLRQLLLVQCTLINSLNYLPPVQY